MLDAGDGIDPSFFEVTTAVALLAFARTPADACILEVGLGGRLDATNVIEQPLVCGIASLAIDHQHFWAADDRYRWGESRHRQAGAPLVTQRYPPPIAAPHRRSRRRCRCAGCPRRRWDATVRTASSGIATQGNA